jgi:hypothetical protein
MKQPTNRKLALRTQTIRPLTDVALAAVAGGSQQPQPAPLGFIMKDSVIVKTSTR